MSKLFSLPSPEKMKKRIIAYYSRVWDGSNYLQKTFPDKAKHLERIKTNLVKYDQTELTRSYYKTLPSYV